MTTIEDRLVAYVDRLDAGSTPITADEVLAGRTRSGQRGRALFAAGLVLIVLAAGVIISQAGNSTHTANDPADPPTTTPPSEALAPLSEDVSLWLSTAEAAPGDTEIVAVLLNHTGVDTTFGVAASVERWDGQEWVPHRLLAMCLDHWHCTAEPVSLDDPLDTPDIGLVAEPDSPGPPERFSTVGLAEGWYRISQTANEGDVASGVLHVVEGAEPQVPLWPTDAPAISVAPSIVSPDGGPISLSPLVPPVDGGLSIDDIEEAVEGLAEAASIERWNGSGWDPAGEVPLAADEDVGLFARSTDLPPLAPGAYRLLRTGSDEPHVGNLWVVDDADLDGEGSDGSAAAVSPPVVTDPDCDDVFLSVQPDCAIGFELDDDFYVLWCIPIDGAFIEDPPVAMYETARGTYAVHPLDADELSDAFLAVEHGAGQCEGVPTDQWVLAFRHGLPVDQSVDRLCRAGVLGPDPGIECTGLVTG